MTALAPLRVLALGVLALGVLALGVGCTVTETGNPEAALTSHTSEPRSLDFTPIGEGTYVMEAWLGVASVTFLPEGTCGDPSSAPDDAVGPFVFDAVGDTPVLELAAIDGRYCGVRIPRARAIAPLPAGAPALLEGATIYVRGQRADGVPFEVIDRTERVTLLSDEFDPAPIEISRTPRTRFVIAWDLATMMEGFNLFGAEIGADGVIHITETQNVPLYEAFMVDNPENIGVYPDLDGDGELDDDEFGMRFGKVTP